MCHQLFTNGHSKAEADTDQLVAELYRPNWTSVRGGVWTGPEKKTQPFR